MHCAEFVVELPGTFPYSEWKTFFQSCKTYSENSEQLGDFVRAMQASAYQFRTASEALTSMIADWTTAKGQLDFEGKYRQQRDLSSFVGAALTSIESAAYACYVTLTQKQSVKFPWGHVKRRTSSAKLRARIPGSRAPLIWNARAML